METPAIAFAVYLLPAFALALLFDWSFYARMLGQFVQFGRVDDSARWSRTLFPRVLFTLAAAIIVVLAVTFGPGWLMWVALAVFLVGQFHALARVVMD